MSEGAAHADAPTAWRAFSAAFGAVAVALLVLLYGFVIALDPFGRRVGPDYPPTPLMDVNQRYMYPQLARSGLFDSAIFGTSTARLLDPRELGAALGGRFANLAVNAGTPWEQTELARLFLRHVKAPRTLVFALDRAWCDPWADFPMLRLTFRSFPPWLYDENALNDYPELLSSKSLEIAGRVALNRLGLMPPRIRQDGYEVFTPPEETYDLARAREHLRMESGPALVGIQTDPPTFPAIGWLAEVIRAAPPQTRIALLFPPLHASALPTRGAATAQDEACKAAAIRTLAGRDAVALDYRQASTLTEQDANFWDKLHYRLPIASRIASAIAAAFDGRAGAEAGEYRLMRARS